MGQVLGVRHVIHPSANARTAVLSKKASPLPPLPVVDLEYCFELPLITSRILTSSSKANTHQPRTSLDF
jgi:hypothetical protein